MRFRGSDIFSSACVTSATRTYIYRRLPLEASHCVLEYVLRLPGTSDAQDIFRYIIVISTRSFFNFHGRESCQDSLSHSHTHSRSILFARLPRGSPRFRSSAKIFTTREEGNILDSDAIIRFRNKNNRIFAVEGNGQGSDSMVDGGDSAHDRCGHRAACSRQEERQSRLSRLFDQVRRVSGE